MKIPFEVRYRSFYLRHLRLRRFLPAWKVYVK